VDLKNIINEKEQSYEIWVDFRGFEIKIGYLDKGELQAVLKRSKSREYDRKTHQPVEKYSDEKLGRNLAHLIIDWRGLTLSKLSEMVPIKIDPEEANTPVPYSQANAETLVTEAYGLDNFLMDTVTDLQAFREEKTETEIKNLKPSHGNVSNLAETRAKSATVPSETA